jgi:hypothetical protein
LGAFVDFETETSLPAAKKRSEFPAAWFAALAGASFVGIFECVHVDKPTIATDIALWCFALGLPMSTAASQIMFLRKDKPPAKYLPEWYCRAFGHFIPYALLFPFAGITAFLFGTSMYLGGAFVLASLVSTYMACYLGGAA